MVKGFIITTYKKDWPIAFTEMNQYIKDVKKNIFLFTSIFISFISIKGKLKVRETLYEGFGNMRNAFCGLFKGENTGKAIVKA
jgi:NADPH-dependent curcumin reductase CurA